MSIWSNFLVCLLLSRKRNPNVLQWTPPPNQPTLRDYLWRNTRCINCCLSVGSPLISMRGREKTNLCQYPLGERIKVRSSNYQQEMKRWVALFSEGVRRFSRSLTTITNAREAAGIHIIPELGKEGKSFHQYSRTAVLILGRDIKDILC